MVASRARSVTLSLGISALTYRPVSDLVTDRLPDFLRFTSSKSGRANFCTLLASVSFKSIFSPVGSALYCVEEPPSFVSESLESGGLEDSFDFFDGFFFDGSDFERKERASLSFSSFFFPASSTGFYLTGLPEGPLCRKVGGAVCATVRNWRLF